MTRFERIKQLSLEDFIQYLLCSNCHRCVNANLNEKVCCENCYEGIKAWQKKLFSDKVSVGSCYIKSKPIDNEETLTELTEKISKSYGSQVIITYIDELTGEDKENEENDK